MAVRAGVNLDFLECGTRNEFAAAACAYDFALIELRMDVLLHVRSPFCLEPHACSKKVLLYLSMPETIPQAVLTLRSRQIHCTLQ